MDFSIIIPVKNENEQLAQLFSLLQSYPKDIKIYFCNGGCTDNSFDLIKIFIQERKNAFIYDNMSLKQSILTTVLSPINDIKENYVLVHPVDIDCSSFIFDIAKFPYSEYYVFYKSYYPERKILKIQEFILNKIRLNLFKSFVWTNGLLIKTDILKDSASLKNDFLEDVILSDKLKQRYKCSVIRQYVKCSARRYITNGVTAHLIINIIIMILYRIFKVRPTYLKSIYYRLK
jgi:hypothetical protein